MRVCVPVSVATVLSIAIVTGALPLKLVPLNPVPIVKALAVVPAEDPDEAAVIRPFASTVIFAVV